MNKLTKFLISPFVKEDIKIPVKVGDTIMTGRFKNKKTIVKHIDKDEYGMPVINGKKVTTFRLIRKDDRKIINAKKAFEEFFFMSNSLFHKGTSPITSSFSPILFSSPLLANNRTSPDLKVSFESLNLNLEPLLHNHNNEKFSPISLLK